MPTKALARKTITAEQLHSNTYNGYWEDHLFAGQQVLGLGQIGHFIIHKCFLLCRTIMSVKNDAVSMRRGNRKAGRAGNFCTVWSSLGLILTNRRTRALHTFSFKESAFTYQLVGSSCQNTKIKPTNQITK